MQLSLLKLASLAVLATGLVNGRPQASEPNTTTTTNSAPKIILDNDWGPTDFTLILMALASKYELLGLTSSTGNTWPLQSALHALRSLELGNLTSCIPVHKGADYPLLNTATLFQTWQYIHGALPWQGVFAPQNLTAQSIGFDPTSGDPSNISVAAFIDGVAPSTDLLAGYQAATFLIDSVHKYPGEVTIFAAGALTNIALAVRLDPTFASTAKELVIMGGYLDTTLFQVTGDVLQADVSSDINLKIDPESSKIALTADFPNITLVGNAANSVYWNASDYADLATVNNSYTAAFAARYFPVLPLWDATALAVALDRDTVLTNSTEMYVDVDVSWFSPYYGEIRGYQQALVAMGQQLRTVTYAFNIDEGRVKSLIKDALFSPGTCADL